MDTHTTRDDNKTTDLVVVMWGFLLSYTVVSLEQSLVWASGVSAREAEGDETREIISVWSVA